MVRHKHSAGQRAVQRGGGQGVSPAAGLGGQPAPGIRRRPQTGPGVQQRPDARPLRRAHLEGQRGIRQLRGHGRTHDYLPGRHSTRERPSPSAPTGTARGNRAACAPASSSALWIRARAIEETRGLADDQVVSAKITLDAYGTPASGQQSWYGLQSEKTATAITRSPSCPTSTAASPGAAQRRESAGDDDAGTGHRDGFHRVARTNSGWKPLATGCGVTWMETRCAKCRRASSRAEASAWPTFATQASSMTSRLISPEE